MNQRRPGAPAPRTKDLGPEAVAVNLACMAKQNTNYRTALWTGEHLQVTLMSIPVGSDIGLEKHDHLDQLLRIEEGCALLQMGKSPDSLGSPQKLEQGWAVLVPACTWHNLMNGGNTPLKISSIYAPPQHPFGTIHRTKRDSQRAEKKG